MNNIKSLLTVIMTAPLCSCSVSTSSESQTPAQPEFSLGGEIVQSVSGDITVTSLPDIYSKTAAESNPILSDIFCADPTAVEYDGRLYIYGTNDHQQYEAVGAEGKNTYEHIKSLVMISTDDMVNYTYHGTIDVGEICPWALASWAPSITSRVEEDGLTHFYLYFSNSGWGTGVITATSPTGPWSDPLGTSLIDGNTPELNGCSSPFDPGVCIDDNGTGWLAFGSGDGGSRIVRLGSDMLSIDSEIAKIPSRFNFEASELNYINGTYVYTYNNDWSTHSAGWDVEGVYPPPQCSMSYMTTKTPLDPDSWVYRDYYFKNPGEAGLEYSNNHTHLQKYQGKYYLFYHSLFPQKSLGTFGGFRSLCVNEASVDEDTVTIEKVTATREGVSQIKNLDPFLPNQAETLAACAGTSYAPTDEPGNITVSCKSKESGAGAWLCVRGADFGGGAEYFAARVKGTGRVDVYLDSIEGTAAASVEFSGDDWQTVYAQAFSEISGVHDVYFVIPSGFEFDSWQFA